MTEKMTASIRDKASMRWLALIIVSLTMFGAYYFNYALSPLKPYLESMQGWTSSDFGMYTGAYGWFNVFLLMLIFSGIVLDKMGIRFTGFASTLLMLGGTSLNYWALIHTFPEGVTLFGLKSQVFWSAIGFAIFGVGTEAAGITVSKAIVKWFKGYEMALAMGMQMSIARLGTALALGIALPVANKYTFTTPVLLAVVFMLIGVASFLVYSVIDKKLDNETKAQATTNSEDEFKFSDISLIVKNKGFWYIALLCLLFYSAVFPFLFYATDLVINKYHVNPNFAGLIPMLLPFGTIFLTPLFGGIYDKKGKGATIMIFGAILLIFVHGLLAIPFLTSPVIAIIAVIILGIGFSLVPSAMWPSVPKIIPERILGTAYSVIFWIQNIGLMTVPILLGIILDKTNPDVTTNKALISETLNKTYTEQLANMNLSSDEIATLSKTVSTALIDSVVKTAYYEEVPNASLNLDEVSNQISEATIAAMPINSNGNTTQFKKELENNTLSAVYPVIVNNKVNIRYNYLYVLLLFVTLGLLSLIFAFLLKAEDKKKGYGLELPNIKADAEEVLEAESEANQ